MGAQPDVGVVAIFGPTGSGKTDVAVHVARKLGTEVVNCDPAQCYAGFPILTNKPGPEHDAVAPHRMVGTWALTRHASVAQFATEARAEIDTLVAERGVAVACGGSGLYLRAALTDLEFATDEVADEAPIAGELRAQLEAEYDAGGGEAMHARLAGIDPTVADKLHPNNRPRLIRALEAALEGGTVAPASMWDTPYRHDTAMVGLAIERPLVRERIGRRTEAMWDGGLIEEVAATCGTRGEHWDYDGVPGLMSATAARLHGLSDVVAFLRGDESREGAIEAMATRTRQYAKRQDTWRRRWPGLWPVEIPAGERSPAPDQIARLVGAERNVHAIRQVARPRQ